MTLRRRALCALAVVLASCAGESSAGSPHDASSSVVPTPTNGVSAAPSQQPATATTAPDALVPCADVLDAADGRVAFTVGGGMSNGVATVNADGSGYADIVEPGELRDQPHAGTESPRWATDDQILFSSNRSGGPDDWHVFTVGATGGEVLQLTDGNDGIEYQPSTTADGSTIAYGKAVATPEGPDPYKEAGIFLADAAGDNERQLTIAPEDGVDEWPDISPDGNRVVFSRARSATGGLYVVDLDGSGLTRIVGPEMQPYRPRWSPDGSMVVFSNNADRAAGMSANVWIVNADGSGLRQLTQAAGTEQAWAPDWSPSGELIVFVHQPPGRRTNDLAVIDLDGVPQCTLWSPSGNHSAMDPDWGGPLADR